MHLQNLDANSLRQREDSKNNMSSRVPLKQILKKMNQFQKEPLEKYLRKPSNKFKTKKNLVNPLRSYWEIFDEITEAVLGEILKRVLGKNPKRNTEKKTTEILAANFLEVPIENFRLNWWKNFLDKLLRNIWRNYWSNSWRNS